MLDTAQKVNPLVAMIIQIYEIQTPAEAESMIDLGVDHIGSVVLSETEWKIPVLKETVDCIRTASAKSSLIPLFNRTDTVLRTLEYYQPDIVHFCEALTDSEDIQSYCRQLTALQQRVKNTFPHIQIMRSIPIVQSGVDYSIPTLELSRKFESYSDFFLTDTVLVDQISMEADRQPVQGFVGITGQTCDWDIAADLVAASRIPVILAGGISPGNVGDGIQRTRPAGVDSCTLTNAVGENGQPIRFMKDQAKVRRFIEAAREIERTSDDG